MACSVECSLSHCQFLKQQRALYDKVIMLHADFLVNLVVQWLGSWGLFRVMMVQFLSEFLAGRRRWSRRRRDGAEEDGGTQKIFWGYRVNLHVFGLWSMGCLRTGPSVTDIPLILALTPHPWSMLRCRPSWVAGGKSRPPVAQGGLWWGMLQGWGVKAEVGGLSIDGGLVPRHPINHSLNMCKLDRLEIESEHGTRRVNLLLIYIHNPVIMIIMSFLKVVKILEISTR